MTMFQFQYGTIKRAEINTLHSQIVAFQFQYGTIKSDSLHCYAGHLLLVSIPIWYD